MGLPGQGQVHAVIILPGINKARARSALAGVLVAGTDPGVYANMPEMTSLSAKSWSPGWSNYGTVWKERPITN
jgi:hypothetical protein